MNRPSQIANPLAMDNSDLKDAGLLAFGKILANHTFHVFWLKGVQIQDTVDRQLNSLLRFHRFLFST